MKRHPALVTLSHEHHHGLRWARKLRELDPEIPEDRLRALASEFLEAWDSEINPHFWKEEEILLPLHAREGESNIPEIHQMLQQHISLRREVLRLKEQADRTILGKLAELLTDHIRLEEREVFPRIEQDCSQELLGTINEQLEQERSLR